MVQCGADGFGNQRFGRDACELLLEPGLKRHNERLALLLACGTALLGATPADCLLDGIERRDALKSFAGDRSTAILGEIKEPAAQMGPQKASVITSPHSAAAIVL